MGSENLFDQFKALYKEKELDDHANLFIEDGINNPELFAQQETKVLFIAKEHNYIGKPSDEAYKEPAYRVWSKQGVYLQFAHRLSEWAYGLMTGFTVDFDQLTYDDKHKALQSIAFINVKKASGKAAAKADLICQYISASQSLLHQQITDIAPTLIICCFRYDYFVELLFAGEKADSLKMVRSASNAYSMGKWNGIPIINFYHPSSRKNKKWLYDQLGQAYEQVKSN